MSFSFWQRQRPTLVLIAVIAIASVVSYGHAFWLDNSVMIAIFGLMAISVGMAYGHAGILSVATAVFAAIGAYGTAIVTTRYELSPYVGLVLAIVLPALVAYPLARALTRLSPLPLSIATFLLSGVFEILVREGGDFTGGFIGLSGIPALGIAAGVQQMHFLAWGIVIVVVALVVNLMSSAFGRAVTTARHDPLRAIADGVMVPHVLASTFAVSASIAGIAGWLYAHHLTYMGPDSLTTHVSISVLLMAVIGGAQTFLGPLVGAALLTLLTLYLPAAEAQGMIFGALLVTVLLVTPRGLLGTDWRALLSRLRGTPRRPDVLAIRPVGEDAR